jgi:cellulose synthase operon protein C
MRRLNIKLLVGLICGLLVTTVSVALIHGYQINRNAESLLREAAKAEKAGDLREAVKLYSQYLRHRPKEIETLGKMANLAADLAEKPDAVREDFLHAFKALEAASKHKDLTSVRRRNVDFLMRLQRYIDAMDYLNDLREEAKAKGQRDVELDLKLATCEMATAHYDRALRILNEIVGFDDQKQGFDAQKAVAPHAVDAYLKLTDILRRRFEDGTRADEVMQQLVAANPESARAHLELGRYDQRLGRKAEAAEELATALKLAPEDADVVLAAADIATNGKDFEKARQLLERGVKEHPENEGMYRGLASLEMAEGNVDQALVQIEAGLETAPTSQALLLFLADLQLQKNDLTGLRSTLDRMRAANFLHELIGYFEGRMAIQEQKWLSASRQFEKLRPQMARWPDLMTHVDLFLGQCYENMSQPDRALEAYNRVMDKSSSVQAALGHARALASLGKRKEANEEWRAVNEGLRKSAVSTPMIRNNVLQIRITEQLQKPADERDWASVDAIVDEMQADTSLTDMQKALLANAILVVKGEFAAAQKQLKTLKAEHPDEPKVWLALANLMQQQTAQEVSKRGKLSEAEQNEINKTSSNQLLKLVKTAEKAAGPQHAFRSIKAQAYLRLGGDEAKQGLAKLEQGINALPATEQTALWSELATAYYRLRDYENLRRCWTKVAEARPDDLKLLQSLFDVAQEFRDEQGMTDALEPIGKIAGTGSAVYKYCLASRLIWEVRQEKKDKTQLAAARKLIDDAQRLRPEWHELARLEGEVDELEGKNESAVVNYQRALELGPPNQLTARRLVILLYRQGKMQDVQQAMKYLGTSVGASDLIGKIDSDSKARTGDVEGALELAKQAVAEEPLHAGNHLWLGQLLERSGQTEAAEEQFRLAIQNGRELPQAWLALVNHLVRNKKKLEAVEAIGEAKQAIPAEQRAALLGQAYELLGDREKAEQFYLGALAEHPDDLAMLRSLAVFYLKANQNDSAKKYVERILVEKPKPDNKAAVANVAWARRAMAEILARTGDFKDVQAAVKLIEENSPDGKPSTDDALTIADILSRRPDSASREKAIQLLEQLQSQRALAPQEQLTLGTLYERSGNWDKARDQMLSLVTRLENNPTILGNFIQMLLRHDELEDTGRWMEKLDKLQPHSPGTIQLKARLLAKQGKNEQAVKYVESAVPNPLKPEQVPILAAVGGLLEELQQYPAAEKNLRSYYERDPKSILQLANFLGRHGNLDEAFQLYEKARFNQPAMAVIQGGLQTLRARPDEVSKQQLAAVMGWLNDALNDEPNSLSLLMLEASLYDLQANLDKVVEIYRKLVARPDADERQRALVKNNLAFALATRGSKQDLAEAEKTVNEAVAYLGPISDLLDTRGMVQLAKGDPHRALADVKTAIADVPDAVKYLHLATIEEQLGNKTAMTEAFAKAVEMKLDPNQLPLSEQKAFKRLQAATESK